MIGWRRRTTDGTSSLRQMSLFSNCKKAELRRIGSLTTTVEVEKGAVLTKEGRPGREFFVVARGTATASRDGLPLAEFGPGSFFGELALLDNGMRTATVVAETDMSLLVSSRAEFWSLHGSVPRVAQKISVEVGKRLRETDERISREPGRVPSHRPAVLLPAVGS